MSEATNETKLELTTRWREEGREEDVAKFRESVRKECRAKGMTKSQSMEHAWRAAAESYPPLPVEDLELSLDGVFDPPTSGDGQTPIAPRGRVTGLGEIPEAWPTLPASASLQSELQWAVANRLWVVSETSAGGFVVSLEKALEPAPSRSALSWLQLAISNPAKFMDLVARKLVDEADDGELVHRERKSISEIRGILSRVEEQADADLLADIPEGIRSRVRSCLDDWGRRFKVELSSEATLSLEAHVGDLVHQCVEVIGEAEGGAS